MRLFSIAANKNLDSFAMCGNSELFLVVFDQNDSYRDTLEIPEHPSHTLEFALGSDADLIGIVTREMLEFIARNPHVIFDRLPRRQLGVIVMVPYACPPDEVRRCDGIVETFICSYEVWAKTITCSPMAGFHQHCYEIISAVLCGDVLVDWISVLQSPSSPPPISSTRDLGSIGLIMAHRGPIEYLRTAISYAHAVCSRSPVHIHVGLDIEDLSEYALLPAAPLLTCFSVQDPPVGPYVIRDALIRRSSEELILFQDSDDVSCTDRVSQLCSTMHAQDLDMVGSHEIEVNEIDKCIRAYRFPLNVTAVLSRYGSSGVSDNAAEPFLHATALMRRDRYIAVGGFSTNRKIASDSQFLLRAHFALRIANADQFLYLRRVHPHALTVAPLTRNGNSLRKSLSQQWGRDFKLVKSGVLSLACSSLRVETENPPRQLFPFNLT